MRTVVLVRPPLLHERLDLRIAVLLATVGLVLGAFAVQRHRARARARVLQDRIDTATAALSAARDALAADNRTLADQTARLDAQNADLDRQNAALARQEAQLRILVREKEARTRELEELDRLKRRLVANTSHELRTPLTLIRGPIEVLAAKEADPDKRAELALASRNAARLDGLVADLLLLSRAESGALPLRARPTPLAALLGRILDRFPAERVVLQPLPDEPSPGLWCDAGILDTAVGNLVANALEHGGLQHPVEVTALLADADGVPGVRIAVRDHGPGVPESARAALFHRFEKGDHQGGGLGLGLALSRELVELHGGVLDHIPPEGGGACFRVWLPLGTDHLSVDDLALDTPTAEAPAEPPPPAPDADSPVLLIEDNSELRAFLATQLGSRRAVVAVEDAESALAWLQQHTPRVVVSDIMLPGISGLDLVRKLRQNAHTAELPVLLISARGEVHDRVEGLEVADDYLAKPFSILELHARVDALVRRAPLPDVASTGAPEAPTRPAWLIELTTALDAHIDAHLDDNTLSAKSLAAAVAMSQRTLSERLRSEDLPSPAEWIRQRRLDRAEQMLEEGRYQTVSEVAAAVGMSRSYFTRVFKARTGLAPGEHRS